jgi:hypothetical protein
VEPQQHACSLFTRCVMNWSNVQTCVQGIKDGRCLARRNPRHLSCFPVFFRVHMFLWMSRPFRDAVTVDADGFKCGHQRLVTGGELSNASADHNGRTVGEYAAQSETDCHDHVLRYGDALISEVCRKLPILPPTSSVPMHQCAKASNGKNVVRTTSPHSCEKDTRGQSSHSLP